MISVFSAEHTGPSKRRKRSNFEFVIVVATYSARKPIGCLAFDGQYVELHLVHEPRDPFSLNTAWLGVWDAIWMCTGCWCIKEWHLELPVEKDDKMQIRFKLKTVTKNMLGDLWFAEIWIAAFFR